ncbi:class IV adenylate cyclase [Lentzea sp. BCCO 10_0856]|uniref:Class IV adenylate cyclase n=1 Tax=Lentzea miocenica TaxID=3095431 RepID=A0ABU4T5L6_9PSEU|nr:class IV adenylate cyclase [Lentzea sp. BCCO 10_0856]MDX8033418.1 class IV adenylate cyclase [Lentzea sp. BCCO 10_0856]
MRYIEVEKKYALPDAEDLKAKLVNRGAKAGDPTNQVDSYHNAPHRDFTEPEAISEWLRVRTDNEGNASINYKLWPAGRAHADEFESSVGDVEAIRRMLEALGFPPLVTVNKTREAWTLDDMEIAFDHVEGAGTFVEFEYKAEEAEQTPEGALAYLDQFIAELDVELGEQIKRGYPHILLGRQR